MLPVAATVAIRFTLPLSSVNTTCAVAAPRALKATDPRLPVSVSWPSIGFVTRIGFGSSAVLTSQPPVALMKQTTQPVSHFAELHGLAPNPSRGHTITVRLRL